MTGATTLDVDEVIRFALARRWRADVLIVDTDDGGRDVTVQTEGGDETEALLAAQFAMKTLAEGKEAFVRRPPWSRAERNFEADILEYRGGARFWYWDRPGEWRYREQPKDGEPVMIGLPPANDAA